MGRTVSNLLHFISLSIFLTAVCPTVEASSSISAFFILGDSSVNCGNNIFIYPFLKGVSSSFLCNFSDQRLIPDLLADKMGSSTIPLFYGQNNTLEGILGGLNFGSSPATILNWGGSAFQGLNQQFRQAFETIQLMQMQLGLEKAQELIESSLFYLSFGKEDYIRLLSDHSGVTQRYKRRGFGRLLVHQMMRVIKDLYNANVRKIICVGIMPLGCTPRSSWLGFNSTAHDHRGCVNSTNALVVEYNNRLMADIFNLNAELPHAEIIFCDVYRGMVEIIDNPEVYGFSNVKSACCGIGRYGGMAGCLSKSMVSCDSSSYVWWDFYNPTEAANSIIADWMWSGSPLRICRPINIQQMASRSVESCGGAPRSADL